MSENHPLSTLLEQHQRHLPATRQGAVALRKLEMQLTPYPAFFREIQSNTLEEIRQSHPELAEQIELALDSAMQAIEMHCQGLKLVTQLLNND
ncbi:hypothetical protein [Vibrio vulnificus]|uniref:hypothetical protein n=1 Tax=Vibrio vulnificus TaxID=672 RepID=UPI001A302D5D|nr:hypothetical protein [Vibrio vulnificus]MCJ0806676.1 hypothetical protein [Vibrio vulnificus]HAS6087730.1 hypothetical protein [Vibrio vulnificus]